MPPARPVASPPPDAPVGPARGGAGAVPSASGAATRTRRIVDSITEAIVERRLMPGTKLAEQSLADLFDVSRTVVRQALNQLSRDRLVTLQPGRGAFVAEPSVEEARQVFEARQVIEAALVRQLCAVITPHQVAALRNHLKQERDAVRRNDVAARTRLLAEFHVLLARVQGNAVLAELLSDLLSRSALISLMVQSTPSAEHSQQEHVDIVDALERRDARTAARLMTQHLAHVEQNLRLHPRATDLASALKV